LIAFVVSCVVVAGASATTTESFRSPVAMLKLTRLGYQPVVVQVAW
jgi:hypothetical protein